jgi:RHS repeat-associated protein
MSSFLRNLPKFAFLASLRLIHCCFWFTSRRSAWDIHGNVSAAFSCERHVFAYDGWNMVVNRRKLNYTTSGIDNSAWVTNVFIWGQDISGMTSGAATPDLQGAGGVGGLLGATLSTTNQAGTTTSYQWNTLPYFYCYDGNGNVSAVLNQDGTAIAVYAYDAFGNATRELKPDSKFGIFPWNDQPITFSTKWRDKTTVIPIEVPYNVNPTQNSNSSNAYKPRHSALHYYGYRYYAPKDGRWLGRDLIGEEGGVNLNSFLSNECVDAIDARGLETFKTKRDASAAALKAAKTAFSNWSSGVRDGVPKTKEFGGLICCTKGPPAAFEFTGPGSSVLLICLVF